MGSFKSQWERAHQSLTGLSAARKAASGVLLVGMIVAGVWLFSSASARAPMAPVLDQPFSDADVLQIAEHLSARKVPHDIEDGRVYVPADRRIEVLSDLIYSDTLIGNTESGFDAMIRQASIFDSPTKTDRMFNIGRQRMLQSVIGRFKGVRKATVLIDPTSERRIGGSTVTPSALVDIQTRSTDDKGDSNPRQLASAAINAVTGAVSAMSRERVKVTIDGVSYNLGVDEFGGDLLEQRQRCEQAHVTKVRQFLSFIPDVLVSVSVELNTESSDSTVREAGMRHEHSRDAAGVLANAVPPISSDPSMEQTLAAHGEESASDFPFLPGQGVPKTRPALGKETVLSASVVVPRSYFVQLYRRGQGNASEPTESLLQPLVDTNLPKIRQLVLNSLGLKNESKVTVDVYDDAAAMPLAAAPAAVSIRQEAAALPAWSTLAKYGTHWGLAVLVLATLLMASMIFRRGSGAMALPHAISQETTPHTSRVSARQALLDKIEADEVHEESDEDADLLHQVRELASAHPDDAARILRDWIRQGA